MSNKKQLIILLISGILICTSCQTNKVEPSEKESTNIQKEEQTEHTFIADETRKEELYQLATKLTNHLEKDEIEQAMEMFDEEMTKAMDGKLSELFKQLVIRYGKFKSFDNYSGTIKEGYEIIELTLTFEKNTLIQRTVFNKKNQISGLFYNEGKVEGTDIVDKTKKQEEMKIEQIPENIEETKVKVDANNGYPLDGYLTMPKDTTPKGAIVIIHGSGPLDANGTIGPNNPYQDIVYQLSKKGYATLRYNK